MLYSFSTSIAKNTISRRKFTQHLSIHLTSKRLSRMLVITSSARVSLVKSTWPLFQVQSISISFRYYSRVRVICPIQNIMQAPRRICGKCLNLISLEKLPYQNKLLVEVSHPQPPSKVQQ